MVDNTPEVNSGATEGFVLLDLMCSVLRLYIYIKEGQKCNGQEK